MTVPAPPEDIRERVAYATESVRLAEDNWNNIYPWRWLRWYRQDRVVRQRNRLLRAANERTREELAA